MPTRTPALLVILVEPVRLRWFAASITLDGKATPLLRSDTGDLSPYLGQDLDEQVNFLRHRFCGALQRGSLRLWEQDQKACQFVFVFEGPLPEPTGELTGRIADHLVEWMFTPPVVVLTSAGEINPDAPPSLDRLAGQLDPLHERLICSHLGELLREKSDLDRWELYRKPPA